MGDAELLGAPADTVVETLAERENIDTERVRETLDPFIEEGHVTREGIETTVSDTAQVVATAETRVELAAQAHETATEAASQVADVSIVAERLAGYDERLDSLTDRLDALSDLLQSPVGGLADPALFETATELRTTASRAQGVVQTADDLQNDLEQFESWLTDPAMRAREFREDVTLVEQMLTDIEDPVEMDEKLTPAAWAIVQLQTDVFELLVADLRAEAADLRTLGAGETDLDAYIARVETLADRIESIREALDATDVPYDEEFGAVLDSMAETLAGREPPVEWGEIQEALNTHSTRVREQV